MISHPGVWLVKYMAWTCGLTILPQLIITYRAVVRYPECRFVSRYLWDKNRMAEILVYSGCRCLCSFSHMLSQQGSIILVNKMLGPVCNAAMTIGNTVSGHCAALSTSFIGAYSPAITNAAGAGDYVRMRKLIFMTCASASAAIILFVLMFI